MVRKKKGNRKSFIGNNEDRQCSLCAEGVKYVRYKDVFQLKKFTSAKGKIVSREKSGLCARHQRRLARAIKRARYMALIPYADTEL